MHRRKRRAAIEAIKTTAAAGTMWAASPRRKRRAAIEAIKTRRLSRWQNQSPSVEKGAPLSRRLRPLQPIPLFLFSAYVEKGAPLSRRLRLGELFLSERTRLLQVEKGAPLSRRLRLDCRRVIPRHPCEVEKGAPLSRRLRPRSAARQASRART